MLAILNVEERTSNPAPRIYDLRVEEPMELNSCSNERN